MIGFYIVFDGYNNNTSCKKARYFFLLLILNLLPILFQSEYDSIDISTAELIKVFPLHLHRFQKMHSPKVETIFSNICVHCSKCTWHCSLQQLLGTYISAMSVESLFVVRKLLKIDTDRRDNVPIFDNMDSIRTIKIKIKIIIL